MGDDLEPVGNAIVVIENGVISAAGAHDEVELPRAAAIDDRPHMTLLPGFIDAHVHIGFYPPKQVLVGGVTTVRDLGWPPEQIFALAKASHADDFDGPTIVAAGPMLTAPGGYPARAAWAPKGTALEIVDADNAGRAVASVASAGAATIKIALNPPVWPVLDVETVRAIVGAAHDRGLKVTAHIYGLDQLEKALDTGVDELAHMLMSDELIPPRTIQRMVASNMVVVPTLSIFTGTSLRTAVENLRSFRRAAGRVVYGTDLGNEGPLPGIDAHEIGAFAAAGMSGEEIIRCATVDSAAWLGLEGKGTIAEGKDADLVLVDGDPVADPNALTRIRAVWRRGRLRER